MSKNKTKVLNSLQELDEAPQYEATLVEKYGNLKDKRKEVDLINAKVSGKINTDINTMRSFRRHKTRFIVIAEANKVIQAEYPTVAECVRAVNELQKGSDVQRKAFKYIKAVFGIPQLAKHFNSIREDARVLAEEEEKDFEELKKTTHYPMWESAYATMQKHKHLHENIEVFCGKIQKKTVSLKVYEEYEILRAVWMNFLMVEGYVGEGDWKGSMASLIAKFVNSLKKRISK